MLFSGNLSAGEGGPGEGATTGRWRGREGNLHENADAEPARQSHLFSQWQDLTAKMPTDARHTKPLSCNSYTYMYPTMQQDQPLHAKETHAGQHYQTCQQTTKQRRMASYMHACCDKELKTDTMGGKVYMHELALTKNLCLRSSAAVGRASGSLSKHLPTTSRSAYNTTQAQFIHCTYTVLGTHRGHHTEQNAVHASGCKGA